MFPSKQDVTICFAHAAYQMKARFDVRKTGIKSFQVWAYDDLQKRVGEADVVVVSGMWKNDLIPAASKLKFIQSISSGMDQYSKEQLAAKKVRLAARPASMRAPWPSMRSRSSWRWRGGCPRRATISTRRCGAA